MSIFIILFLTKKSFRYSFYVTVTESSGNLERSRHCKQISDTNAIAPQARRRATSAVLQTHNLQARRRLLHLTLFIPSRGGQYGY